ncbi:MAG: RNA polymerase sigma-70 factor [Rhodothermales bacterium]
MATPTPEALAGWAQQIKYADRSAFSALFSALYPKLLWYTQTLIRDESTARDIVQEAFIRLWDRRAAIDPSRSIQALLYVTVRNLTRNHQRDTQTRSGLLERLDTSATASSPDERFTTRMLGQHIRQWVDALPDRQREAFELSRYCGLTHREVSRVMGLSPQTVDKHITRSLRHLRQQLSALDPDLLPS